mgnify:CR=1 FL=1|jgi:Uncharacterized protein containing LysM domain
MPDTPWYQVGPAADAWRLGTEPAQATAIGSPESEPLAIYLGSRAMELLDRHIAQRPSAPLAGLLLGYPLEGPHRRFLLVTDLIAFELSPDDDVRFTSSLFEELELAWREREDGCSVVGWFHAAPERGVALSSFHQFNHHRYFPKPWQVVLIVDTSRHASLLYRWEGEVLVPCDSFYYWNMELEPLATLLEPPVIVSGAAFTETAATTSDAEKRRLAAFPWWLWLLMLLAAYALIPQAPGSLSWVRRQVQTESRRLAELQSGLAALAGEERRLQQELQATTNRAAIPAPSTETARSASRALPALDLGGNDAPVTPTGGDTRSTGSRDYVIQPGDTMWSISRTLLGDPRAFRELAEANQIEDPNIIYPGQRLTVPEE